MRILTYSVETRSALFRDHGLKRIQPFSRTLEKIYRKCCAPARTEVDACVRV